LLAIVYGNQLQVKESAILQQYQLQLSMRSVTSLFLNGIFGSAKEEEQAGNSEAPVDLTEVRNSLSPFLSLGRGKS
jgi:hypothetical protein